MAETELLQSQLQAAVDLTERLEIDHDDAVTIARALNGAIGFIRRSLPLPDPAEGRWRSIDSAPKDGTHFMGWSAERGVTEAVYDGDFEDNGEPCWMDYHADDAFRPTYWQPLPSPPVPSQEGASETEEQT